MRLRTGPSGLLARTILGPDGLPIPRGHESGRGFDAGLFALSLVPYAVAVLMGSVVAVVLTEVAVWLGAQLP